MDVIVLIWVLLSHFSIVNYPKSMECLFKLEVWEGMTQHAKPRFSHQIHTLYYLLPNNWYVSCFSQTAGATFWLRLTPNTLFLNWSKHHYLGCYSISCLIFTWQVGGAYQLTWPKHCSMAWACFLILSCHTNKFHNSWSLEWGRGMEFFFIWRVRPGSLT